MGGARTAGPARPSSPLSRMRISLCMIVRDEEAVLGRCLESAVGVADELCIVDTGSLDATRAVAERFGARTADFDWCDDFSRARNASIELATGDWILVVDADERIACTDARDKLEAFAREHPGTAGLVSVLEHGAGETSRVAHARFFPRAGHRFRGRIHERVEGEPGAPRAAETGLALDHFGYAPEAHAPRERLERHRRLLESTLRESPGEAHLWYQLGRLRARVGEHAGALAAFEQALSQSPDDAAYAGHLVESAGYALRALGRSGHALGWLSQVEERYRDRPDTCFLIALLAMDTGDLARAETGFQRCIALAGTAPEGGESSLGASTYAAAYNLGVMREVLGAWDEALAWYQRALACRPDHGPSLQGLARLRAGRHPDEAEF